MTRRKPRPHQKEAIAAAIKHFKKNDKGRLIMACGTGKTLTSLWIAEALKAKKILISVPSLNLSAQNLDQWHKEYSAIGKHINFLCVCSDQTVGELKDDDGNVDLITPVTTDPKVLQRFVESNREFVIITTYASNETIIKALGRINFCLTIHDEAHRTAGAEGKHYSQLIADRINTRKRLFMTATERLYSSNPHDVISMDDESIYGQKFHELDFRTAIKLGILCDYEIKLVHTDNASIQKFLKENNNVKDKDHGLEDRMRSVAAAVMLQKDFKAGKIHRCISFHNTIKNAKLFNNTLEKVGKSSIKSYHINGKMNAVTRRRILESFASNKNVVLTNSRTLTEGQDIPSLDAIVFCDKRNSVIDIAQSLGRAIRIDKSRPNKKAIIYLPVYEVGEYQEMLRILRDLVMIDSKLRVSISDPSPGGGGMITVEDDSKTISYERIFRSIQTRNAFKYALPPPSIKEVEKYCDAHGIKTLAQYIKLYKAGQLPAHFQHTIGNHPDYHKSKLFIESRNRAYHDVIKTDDAAPWTVVKQFIIDKKIPSYKEYRKLHLAGKCPKNFLLKLSRYKEYQKLTNGKGSNAFAIIHGAKRPDWSVVVKFIEDNDIRSYLEYQRWAKDKKVPADFVRGLHQTYDEFTVDVFKSEFALLSKKEQYDRIFAFCSKHGIKSKSMYTSWLKEKKLPRGFPNDPDRNAFKDFYKQNPIFTLGANKTAERQLRLDTIRKSITLEGMKMFCLRNNITTPTKFTEAGRNGKLPEGYPYTQDGMLNFNGIDIRPHVFIGYDVPEKYFIEYIKKHKIRTYDQYVALFHSGKLPIAFKERPWRLTRMKQLFQK